MRPNCGRGARCHRAIIPALPTWCSANFGRCRNATFVPRTSRGKRGADPGSWFVASGEETGVPDRRAGLAGAGPGHGDYLPELHLQLLPRAEKGAEGEANLVPARFDRDCPEENIGFEDRSGMAVNIGAPPRVPYVVEHNETAAGRVNLDNHFRIGIAHNPRGAVGWTAGPRIARRRILEQHRLPRIDSGPAGADQL